MRPSGVIAGRAGGRRAPFLGLLAVLGTSPSAVAWTVGPDAPLDLAVGAFGLPNDAAVEVLDAIEAHVAAPDLVVHRLPPMPSVLEDDEQTWARKEIENGAELVVWLSRSSETQWRVYGLRKGATEPQVREVVATTGESGSQDIDRTTFVIVANALVHSLIAAGVEEPSPEPVTPPPSTVDRVAPPAEPPRARRVAELSAMYMGSTFSAGSRWQSGVAGELRGFVLDSFSVALGYAYMFPHHVTMPERINLALQRNLLTLGVAGHWRPRLDWAVMAEARANYDRWRVTTLERAADIELDGPEIRGHWTLGPAARAVWSVHPFVALQLGVGVDINLESAALSVTTGTASQEILRANRARGYVLLGAQFGWSVRR